MLAPDYLDRITDEIVALYDQLNTSIIEDMARRIMRIGLSDTTTWQSDITQEAGEVFNDVIARIAEITGESEQVLHETFMDAGAQALPENVLPKNASQGIPQSDVSKEESQKRGLFTPKEK